MPKINDIIINDKGETRKIRIWSDKGVVKNKKRLVGKRLVGRYFYLYDRYGNRILESGKEFTGEAKENLLDIMGR